MVICNPVSHHGQSEVSSSRPCGGKGDYRRAPDTAAHPPGGRRFPRDQPADALVKLLDQGKIPYEQPGRHRRVMFSDLLRYVDLRRDERTAALDRMTEEASEAGIYGGRPEDYAAALKKARKDRSRQDAS